MLLMDLTLNNEINKNNTKDNQIEVFMQELQNSLKKFDSTTTLNMEILNETDLAIQHRDSLNGIVNKCMEKLSYEYDFLYFDYDKKEKNYYFDLYSNGEVTREYLSHDDVEGMESKKGTIWRIWDEYTILESDDLKDNIKFSTEYELQSLESKKKSERR